MNDLIPAYEAESGQVILEGRPAGPAGEAGLVPVAGVDLAFDRADGHLVRAIVDAGDAPTPALLARLFGPRVTSLLHAAAGPGRPGGPTSAPSTAESGAGRFIPEPRLAEALSRLSRLDAAQATSPVPASSPWWAGEAAVLAEQAGLPARAAAEAARAVHALDRGRLVLPAQAAQTAHAVADIAASKEPEAARRVQRNVVIDDRARRPGLQGLDAAAEAKGWEKGRVCLPGLHWVLDPGMAPGGLFRPGLSPASDLLVRYDGGAGCLVVQLTPVPGAAGAATSRYQVRLVDPDVRRVLGVAHFEPAGTRVRAELRLSFPLDEIGETWLEVLEGAPRPVGGRKAHLIRRALRWADAALRAERAPAGLAPWSTGEDWAALATLAWEQCRHDWAAAGDPSRAAAVPEPTAPLPSPACLAEVLGE